MSSILTDWFGSLPVRGRGLKHSSAGLLAEPETQTW